MRIYQQGGLSGGRRNGVQRRGRIDRSAERLRDGSAGLRAYAGRSHRGNSYDHHNSYNIEEDNVGQQRPLTKIGAPAYGCADFAVFDFDEPPL